MMNTPGLISPFQIGYLWQSETADMTALSATVLHINAVIQSLENRNHSVRMVTFKDKRPGWSDDRKHWHLIHPQTHRFNPVSMIESPLRKIQSHLHLPFIRFFDSLRFADAVVDAPAGFDVLYERFWMMGYGGLLAAKRLGIPLIYEINGDLVAEYAQLGIQLSKAQWAMIHLIHRLMFHYVDHVVTVSDALRQKTIERWRVDPAKVSTIPNGAHVELFAEKDQVESVRARYHLNGAPTIAFVGSFKPWHGIDLLIDAFYQVASHAPEARLLLVGDGPVRGDLEKQVDHLHLEEQVIFTGRVAHTDVAALLQTAQITVVNPRVSDASRAQSPLKLFEYMAAGRAIIAPQIPTIEQILTDRVNALLVPPSDVDALAKAFLELLQNDQLRTELGHSAKQQALTKHSWRETAVEIEAIMHRLCGQSVPKRSAVRNGYTV